MPPGTATTLPSLSAVNMKLLTPPGFISPRQRVAYDAPEFLDVLQRAFPFFLPTPSKMDEGIVTYYMEGLQACQPLYDSGLLKDSNKNGLHRGLSVLDALCKDEKIPENLRSMLLNLRVPDPRLEPERYQLAKMESGGQKLIALWAYESSNSPHIPIREAIELLAPVQQKGLEVKRRFFKKLFILVSLIGLLVTITGFIGIKEFSDKTNHSVNRSETFGGDVARLSEKSKEENGQKAELKEYTEELSMDIDLPSKGDEKAELNIESMISASEAKEVGSKDLFEEIVR